MLCGQLGTRSHSRARQMSVLIIFVAVKRPKSSYSESADSWGEGRMPDEVGKWQRRKGDKERKREGPKQSWKPFSWYANLLEIEICRCSFENVFEILWNLQHNKFVWGGPVCHVVGQLKLSNNFYAAWPHTRTDTKTLSKFVLARWHFLCFAFCLCAWKGWVCARKIFLLNLALMFVCVCVCGWGFTSTFWG